MRMCCRYECELAPARSCMSVAGTNIFHHHAATLIVKSGHTSPSFLCRERAMINCSTLSINEYLYWWVDDEMSMFMSGNWLLIEIYLFPGTRIYKKMSSNCFEHCKKMNLPLWSIPSSPFHPSTNYYAYPYIPSPYNSGVMFNSSFQTSLNSSSGYESASSELSFIDPNLSSPPSLARVRYPDTWIFE